MSRINSARSQSSNPKTHVESLARSSLVNGVAQLAGDESEVRVA
ncbi:MAG: hypothetical protein WCC84_17020 [Candidatus Cybelea sp.]